MPPLDSTNTKADIDVESRKDVNELASSSAMEEVAALRDLFANRKNTIEADSANAFLPEFIIDDSEPQATEASSEAGAPEGAVANPVQEVIDGFVDKVMTDPLQLLESAATGALITGGLILAGPEIAIIAGVAGLAYGAWNLYHAIPEWLHDGDVILNPEKFSSEEVAQSHQDLHDLGGATATATAEAVGGGVLAGFGATALSSVRQTVIDSTVSAVKATFSSGKDEAVETIVGAELRGVVTGTPDEVNLESAFARTDNPKSVDEVNAVVAEPINELPGSGLNTTQLENLLKRTLRLEIDAERRAQRTAMLDEWLTPQLRATADNVRLQNGTTVSTLPNGKIIGVQFRDGRTVRGNGVRFEESFPSGHPKAGEINPTDVFYKWDEDGNLLRMTNSDTTTFGTDGTVSTAVNNDVFTATESVSPETVARLKGAFLHLPEKFRAQFAKTGTIDIGRTMTELAPEYKGQKLRGSDSHADQALGWYQPWDNTIKMGELYQKNGFDETPILAPSPNKVSTLKHEMGHAIDADMGLFSDTEDFARAFQMDLEQNVSALPQDIKSSLRYYLQLQDDGTMGGKIAQSETFAQLFAEIHRTPPNTATGFQALKERMLRLFSGAAPQERAWIEIAFPNTRQLMVQALNDY